MSSLLATLDDHMALRALTNGKAPIGSHQDLFVGRAEQLALFEHDLDLAEAGGASLRILVGELGSGKTMLQHVMADRARQRGFVTMNADLSPDRLLHGRSGEGRALLRDAVLSMRTLGSGHDLAIDSIVGRFANECLEQANALKLLKRDHVRARLSPLHALSKGAEFAQVIETYALAPDSSSLTEKARRWLSAGYTSNSEARDDLVVSGIIDDQDCWSMIKLWGSFAKLAGRAGLALFVDEATVLSGLHPNTRLLNLEQLLGIVNDVLQERAHGLAIVIAVTPRFVSEWDGIGKHEGLSSCLFEQKTEAHGQAEIDTLLLHLQDLSENELVELLQRCRELYAKCHPDARLLPDEATDEFLATCRNRIGVAHWNVPRRIIQSFLALHDRLASYPNLEWRDLLSAKAVNGETDEEFANYAHRQM